MPNSNNSQSRRTVIKKSGLAGAVGLIGLAGCSGDGGDGDGGGSDGGDGGDGSDGGDEDGGSTGDSSGSDDGELQFTIGGVMVPPGSAWEGEQPSGHWEFERRVEERTDGRIQIDNVAEGQLCTETSCPEKVANGVVEIGSASIGNSSKFYPMNDIWMLPYTFTEELAVAHTLTKPETYEQFWVPFAQEFGVIPVWYHAPAFRSINIGLDRYSNMDTEPMLPEHTEGMDCRRTLSQVSGIALDKWGMNPVSVAWSDALQGLRTGTVGGMEASPSPICAYGGNMADSLAASIVNEWMIHNDAKWASVEWLKGLSEENRTILAEESRKLYRDLVRMNDEIHQQRLGMYVDDPPEDSCAVEHDLQFNYLDDDQTQQWRDQVVYEQNKDLYSDIIGSADQIGVDGEAFHEYLVDSDQENSVPTDTTQFTVDAWWDDYLQEM